jgi:HEAT repeat protein
MHNLPLKASSAPGMKKLTKSIAKATCFILLTLIVAYFFYKALGIRAMYLAWRAEQGPSAIPALIGGLDDSSEMTRNVTVSALARFGLEALEPLNVALQNTNPVRREGAAKALGAMASINLNTVPMLKKQSTPLLKAALNDESKFVQVQAARSLWNIEKEPALVITTFVNLLDDPNQNVRYYACWGLREMESLAKDAVPALIKARESGNSLFRIWAEDALREIDPQTARKLGIRVFGGN